MNQTRPTASQSGQTPISQTRRWAFRGLALLIGPLLLALAEGVCRLTQWGIPVDLPAPNPGFGGISRLFVPNQAGNAFVVEPSRLRFFVPESFPLKKGRDVFRIFCLGGSTVQGRPYSKETSFTSWLRLNLEAADPQRRWEVINCGGVSYASYRLVPILRECLDYQPDLVILCTGHNEFLEDRSYPQWKHAPRSILRANRILSRLRIYTGLQNAVLALRGKPTPASHASPSGLGPEVDALLDYRNGLKAYHFDPAWRQSVITEFEFNLRRLIGLARQARVPLLLVRPPSNLRDCPPFKSEHRPDLSSGTRQRWEELNRQARALYRTDVEGAARLLEQAVGLDDQYAETFYSLGQCYASLGLSERAHRAFLQARELDICPLRMLGSMERILANLARETKTPLLDAQALLAAESSWKIPGNDWLVDHIHPSIRGHQLIANALLQEMARQGWVQPEPGWRDKLPPLHQAHFASLDPMYYAHGQRRLDALRAWTEGRADGPPIEEKPSHPVGKPGGRPVVSDR